VGLHVTVIHRKDVEVNVPERAEIGPFTVLKTERTSQDLRDGRVRTEIVLRIAAYETGDLEVPAIDVAATGPDRSVRTTVVGPLPLRIASLLPGDADANPRADAAPVSAMRRDWRWVGLAGGLLGVAALIATARWLRRRRVARARQAPAPPPEAAHLIALRRLAELRASDLLTRGEVKPYYERLSLALRDYLGARYGVDALDMTTAELCEALLAVRAADLPLDAAADLLSGCDLVKFARHRPDGAVARGALDEAVRIVELTREREAAVVS
jgi:hypothetical protein